MSAPLVALTGAAGSGKTTLALALGKQFPSVQVEHFDTIGVPSLSVMRAFGVGDQPGGAWQRAITLQWIGRLEPLLRSGQPVLLEGQIRFAFIEEAVSTCCLQNTRPVLVQCQEDIRSTRLRVQRKQPHLVGDATTGWACFLRDEAFSKGYEIVDTGTQRTSETVMRLGLYLTRSSGKNVRSSN